MMKTKQTLISIFILIILTFFAGPAWAVDTDGDGIEDAFDSDTIYGYVTGAVQEGITVNMYILTCGEPQPYATVTTDAQGYYATGDFPNGRYLVGPDDAGYSFSSSYWVDIPQTEIQSYDFTATALEKIGVLFLSHGGMDTYSDQYLWDAVATQFSFDPNHSVYKFVLWNPANWSLVLETEDAEFALKYLRLFDFEYKRIGGIDPFNALTEKQVADIKTELDKDTTLGLQFEVDWAGFQPASSLGNYPYPRYLYHGPDGPDAGADITYCGEGEKKDVVLEFNTGTQELTAGDFFWGSTSGAEARVDEVTVNSGIWANGDAAGFLSLSEVSGSFLDGESILSWPDGNAIAVGTTKWPDCDPERYNIDGPIERLLKKGASRIIAVDMMMGGVRYSKQFDVINISQLALNDWNAEHGTSIELSWINDENELMRRSYPIEPEGWTAMLGEPITDIDIDYEDGRNPVVDDPDLAALHMSSIEAGMSDDVADNDTAVLFVNHALNKDLNEYFDPKMTDTVELMKTIKAQLLAKYPDMNPANIIGSSLGRPEINPENGLLEHNRDMRGEVYGYAWLYQENGQLPRPANEFGYRTWEALDYLVKEQNVKHIVVANTHIVTASALDLCEMPNQIAREIGYKTWLKWEEKDYDAFPDVGHPFADYWGVWLNTDCGEWQLAYASGTAAFTPGKILTGNTSNATAVIKWLDNNVPSGTLTLKELTGSFLNGELLTDGSGGQAVAAGTEIMTSKEECCFEMGGCNDPQRPYPPVRQAPINTIRSDLDPSLAHDISAYGHVGYDSSVGPPDNNSAVQDQYTGTWSMYHTADDDPRMGELMAKHVLRYLSENPSY